MKNIFIMLIAFYVLTGCKSERSEVLDSGTGASQFFADPGAQAWKFARSGGKDGEDFTYIAKNTVGKWLVGGDGRSATRSHVSAAKAAGQIPVLVLYNIPGRDCGGASSGGAGYVGGYLDWVRGIAAEIGNTKTVVILEPDVLPLGCGASMAGTIQNAVNILNQAEGARVYIDIGHANWLSANDAAQRLKAAGIDNAEGFALNVSNFIDDQKSIAYGQAIRNIVNRNFVIDTSRNGAGSNGEWCNPKGRALGRPSAIRPGPQGLDAFIWIKAPGESDGSCNGGPSAGQFSRELALELARNRTSPPPLGSGSSPSSFPTSPAPSTVTGGGESTPATGGSASPVSGGEVGGFTCEQQKEWNKCGEPWMRGVCDHVCNNSSSGGSSSDGGDYPSCPGNSFCSGGWGWLNPGENGCQSGSAGWKDNGCSCKC